MTDAINNIIKLNAEDSLRFAEALLNPPAPTPVMLAAAKAYKERVRDNLGDTLTLSARDSRLLAEVLLGPPRSPGPALRKAVETYRRETGAE